MIGANTVGVANNHFHSINTFYLCSDLLEHTIRILREEGKFLTESILFWAGFVSKSEATVSHIFAPKGKGVSRHPLRIRVSEETMAAICDMLNPPHLVLLGQVHTHLMEAFHSAADDQNSLDTPGFLSFVVPYGAREGADAWMEWGFYECIGRGKFRNLPGEEMRKRFVVIPDGKVTVYDIQT